MVNDLYLHDVEDAQIDLRARMVRECEAMVAYMASRGFPASETIKDRIDILDVGIARRADIPMADLFTLHGALSETIKPAIPRTVELLAWEARTSKLIWLAPVTAIRRLMGWTFAFFLLFLVTVNLVNATQINAGLFALTDHRWQVFWVTLFLSSLAGLGACFSVLYDARKHVVEGTYDPRIGSNYGIRIGLGLVAGLLLSQILADPQFTTPPPAPDPATPGDNPTTATFGVPLLALLGGFASQLVYTVLNKLVDAAGSVFEPERAAEIKARERAILVESQEKAGREQVQRTLATVELAAELEDADTPEKRRTVVERLIRTASGTSSEAAKPQNAGPGMAALEKAGIAVAFGRTVTELLPRERAERAKSVLDRVEVQIRDLRVLARAARSGDLLGEATRIAADLAKTGPLATTLTGTLGAFAKPLLAAGLTGVTPVGIALALARTTVTQGSEVYALWKTRILDADYSPELLAPEHIDAAAVRAALERSPAFGGAFVQEKDNMAALNDLGRQLASEDDAALLRRYGSRFASPEAFEAALRQFRRALLDPPVQLALDPEIVATSGAKNGEVLVEAIDTLREDEAGRAEVERLFLLASAARGEDDEAAERQRILIEAIEAAGEAAGETAKSKEGKTE